MIKSVAELAGTLANGHLATIDAGHLVHATKPEQFLDCLTAFLTDEPVASYH